MSYFLLALVFFSNSSLNFGSIPEKKEQECYENNNFQNEINFLKKKLLQYENFKKENTIHKKEIQVILQTMVFFNKDYLYTYNLTLFKIL